MVVTSLAEAIGVGTILPFLSVLTGPEVLYQHSLMQPIIQVWDITSPDQLVLPFTIVFMTAIFFAGLLRFVLLYAMTKLSYSTGSDLSIDIYNRALFQNYLVHVDRNSSEVINGIITKVNIVIGGILVPMLTLMSASILAIGIIILLFSINSEVAISISVIMGLFYFCVVFFTKKKVAENSQCIAENSTLMLKLVEEGLGGIRDVIIDGSQNYFGELYRKAVVPFRQAQARTVFVSSYPRFILETVGLITIAAISYRMAQEHGGFQSTIPIVGAMALGAQRMLPSLQIIYHSYTNINGSMSSLEDVLKLLEQSSNNCLKKPSISKFTFQKEIRLKNLSFRYKENTPWVLKNIDLTITKGSRVGIVGETGSGKSTLMDIIMGLLPPTSGIFSIDDVVITNENNREWQCHIAHVPQQIYLSDGTIEENIAFGITKSKINSQLVEKAAQQAQISGVIERWEDAYHAKVGERGIRLSGGQRQRIGIARAFYKKANVLFFDEATSALDSKTEQKLMKEIEGLDKGLTIFLIAHRLSTLNECDCIINVHQNGSITFEDNRRFSDIV